ncbi:hypothetical protein BOX15_Mlig010059g1, partial [Macrostomum lignano]
KTMSQEEAAAPPSETQPQRSPLPSAPAPASDPPTPDYEELMRDIESYNPETLNRILEKLANRQQTESVSTVSKEEEMQKQQEEVQPSLADRLLAIFPDACPEFVKTESANYEMELGGPYAVANIGDVDLEPLVNRWLTRGYQKRIKKWQQQKQQEERQKAEANNNPLEAEVVVDPDEGTLFDWRRQRRDFQLRQPVYDALAQEFPLITKRSLSQVVKAFKYCLPAAYRFLYKVLAYTGQLFTSGSVETETNCAVDSCGSTIVQISDASTAATAAEDFSIDWQRLPFDCPLQLELLPSSTNGNASLMRRLSNPSAAGVQSETNEELLNELRFVRGLMADQMADLLATEAEQGNTAAATGLDNLATANDSSQQEQSTFECECCFGDFQFDEMCQCPEGHLFCRPCLAAYVKEKVYGTGRLTLQCMAPNCDRIFLRSQLCLAVDTATLAKLDERAAEDSVRTITKLFRCPACNWGAEIAEDDGQDEATETSAADAGAGVNNKVFTCLNCEKEVCRLCGADWEEHFGKRCSEIERDAETRLRREFEERMTQARVRTCYQCKTAVMKNGGCNHITCRCGAHFCYVCRSSLPASDPYSHFCNHPNPNACECHGSRCPVQSSTEEDESRAISELRAQGLKRQRDEGFQERPIGPDQPGPSKRSRHS